MIPNLPRLFAHRGCSSRTPENTLAAFSEALDRGVPGVELDVHLCRTGQVVVIHDFDLKRVAGLEAEVESSDWDDLRTSDVGSWKHPAFSGETIPRLEQVFELLGDRMFYDIELKEHGNGTEALSAEVAGLIHRFSLAGLCMVTSFNPMSLRHFNHVDSTVPTGVIYSRSPNIPFLLRHGEGSFLTRCRILKPSRKQTSRAVVAINHRVFSRAVIPWTVDDRSEAEMLFKRGVDAVISNVPETMLDLLHKPSEHGRR